MKRFLFILLLLPSFSYGQITFQKTYGDSTISEYGNAVNQTYDGGYIIIGTREDGQTSDKDIYLIKTDGFGDTLWTKSYGGDYWEYGEEVIQTADSGYLITGATNGLTGGGWTEGLLIKTDKNGDTLWTTLFTGAEQEWGMAVKQCTDGGYIVAGMENSGPMLNAYLGKWSNNGNLIWAKFYGGFFGEVFNSVQQTTDGGFIIGGNTSVATFNVDVYLIKTDSVGDTLWTRTYGGADRDEGNSVQQCTDGGYIIAGTTESFGVAGNNVYLIRTDSNGDTLWTKIYGDIGGRGYSVEQTTDGGYIITGQTSVIGQATTSVYLIKTDGNGDTLWTRAYGEGWNNSGASVQQCSDGGYVIAGYKGIFVSPPANYEILLIKTDANGYSGGCNEYSTNTIVGNPPTIVGSGAFVSTVSFEGYFLFEVGNTTTIDSTYCFDNGIGIKEQLIAENELSIYPNPTEGKFRVESLKFGVEEIEVYDLFGRLVLRTNKEQVDMSSFSKGLYFVKVGEAVRKLILN